ncbi:MAG: DUF389 domain-containing protein, partial [Burkholderiaceae bacterium]
PLMGPIMAIGYGAGTYDFQLVRQGLRNLGIAIVISLITSIIYFMTSPLNAAQSELLARTTPSIWDVLIAIFGGLAGVVGATRKEKTNLIPGVAIATALMPPLCTAGYGIASGNLHYFLGAFYLFTINCVFIALTTALVIRALHVEEKHFLDLNVGRRVKVYAVLLAIFTSVPSVYLAYHLVQDEVFKTRGERFINEVISTNGSYVTDHSMTPNERKIDVTVLGQFLSRERQVEISKQLKGYGLEGTTIEVHQQEGPQRIDIGSIKNSLINDLYALNQKKLEEREHEVKELKERLSAQQSLHDQLREIPSEVKILFPSISEMALAQGLVWSAQGGLMDTPAVIVNIRSKPALSTLEQKKLKDWMSKRLALDVIQLTFEKN